MMITTEQKNAAAEELEKTRERLVEAVDGLSIEQWQFRQADDRWSVAQVVEHLALIEGRIQGLIARIGQGAEAEAGRDDAAMDALILEQVPQRTGRINAPPFVQPAGRWSGLEALGKFVEARTGTIGLLDSVECLRGRVLPHPVFGPWDGYQWILSTAAHTARHTLQIVEIRECAEFPR
ncbi:MAG TPA: DinB family protein [Candidatus Sulfopaludibacter sp.]|jgi:hypothetical protein|nr:DinB family protein [Candidatus Sulfopaludibacter sp.]